MAISMQRARILGTVLSVMTIVLTAFFIPLWLEYAEAIFGGKTSRLSGNNILLDVVLIAGTCFSLIVSVLQLVKIGKGKEIKLHTPVVIFMAYCIILIMSLL